MRNIQISPNTTLFFTIVIPKGKELLIFVNTIDFTFVSFQLKRVGWYLKITFVNTL